MLIICFANLHVKYLNREAGVRSHGDLLMRIWQRYAKEDLFSRCLVSTTSTSTEDCFLMFICITRLMYANFDKMVLIILDAKLRLKYVAEWTRSKITWTDVFDKRCLLYGNRKGNDMEDIHRAMQCISLVQLELKSMIKDSDLYV